MPPDPHAAAVPGMPGLLRPAAPPPPHAMSRSPTPGGLGLHYLSRAGVAAPKQVVHARIVVVGGSSACGVAMLEKLLLAPHVFFTNVTLLSPDGMPTPAPRDADSLTVFF